MFSLHPATLADRAALADLTTRANFDDPYSQTVWPNSTIESRTAGSYARLPRAMLGERSWFMKAVSSQDDEEGVLAAYAQWTFPLPLRKKLRQQYGSHWQLAVSEDMKEVLEREYAQSVDSTGEWPKGINAAVVDACSPAMQAACHRVFPQDGQEYIMLNQLKTLPSHQRRGAGTALLQWGVELADQEGLKICLEATPYGLGLHEKFGFERRAEVLHDLRGFQGPVEEYRHVLMIREPQEASS